MSFILAAGLAALSALIVVEGIARLVIRLLPSRVFTPNSAVEFTLAPGLSDRLQNRGANRYNEIGLRSTRADHECCSPTLRVLLTGGSTAECLVLDDADALFSCIEAAVTSRVSRDVYVAVGAKSSMRLLDLHVLLSEVLRYSQWDAIVFHCGSSDLLTWLMSGTLDDIAANEKADRPAIFAEDSRVQLGIHPKSWGVAELVRRLRRRLRSTSRPRALARSVIKVREARKNGVLVSDVQFPAGFLELVERRARKLFALATQHARVVLFVPQHFNYRHDMPEADRSILWAGAIGDSRSGTPTFLAPDNLERLLGELNATCARVATECAVDVVDIRETLDGRHELFYDDFHYTPEGARLAGERIGSALATRLSR